MQTADAFARLLALPENRSALAAARDLIAALSADAGESPAPLLVLHGPSGTGKTALVQALAEELSHAADRSVCLLAAVEFPLPFFKPGADAEVTAATDTALQRLKEARRCDLLVIEDVQHLPTRACEALAQLLDERRRRRAATVLTANRGPRHLAHRGETLPSRLTTRLAGGLVIALEPWQTPSRLRFLHEMARDRGLDVPDELLTWLAEGLTRGGRQLEGAIHQIESLNRLHGGLPDAALLREHFHSQAEAQRPTVERIARHVGACFRVEPRLLQSPRRNRAVVLARQVSMYLARQLTGLSLQQIGAWFGGRDHTTVLHACRKVEEALRSDLELSGTVRRLRAELA